jgi:hypothetical protein
VVVRHGASGSADETTLDCFTTHQYKIGQKDREVQKKHGITIDLMAVLFRYFIQHNR